MKIAIEVDNATAGGMFACFCIAVVVIAICVCKGSIA